MFLPRQSISRSILERGPQRSAGFALLVTITLLTLVVLLLVGLAAYTRVETAISGNTQKQAQARQNALLALDVALGQLQKYAGPDQRVTATAENFGGTGGSARYTGVWDSTTPGLTARTWLVSGNETNPIAVTPAAPGTTTAELVGRQSTGTANSVTAPLVPITSVGLPGQAGTSTIGRYAWWVGDQGVKAPVGLGDTTGTMSYPPYDSAELRSRIRQQIALGAGPASFEPRDAANATLVKNLIAPTQLPLLKTATGSAVGLATHQANYAAWSPNNFNVLADTGGTGLRRDLSIDPSLLGNAFAAWADYNAYMEDPNAPASPVPLQRFTSDPIRRRYIMQPADSAYPIAPALSFFGLSFSIRNDLTTTNPTKLEVAARCVVGLWNPFTSALVPETGGLQLRVTGLPQVVVKDSVGNTRQVDLQTAMGGSSMNFLLPWVPDTTSDDRSSWLPGRVYNWSALANTIDPGGAGNPALFYERNATQGSGIVRAVGSPLSPSPTPAPASLTVYRQCTVSDPTTLTIGLWRVSDNVKLAEFRSPRFNAFVTSPNVLQTDHKFIDFAYIFRMPDVTEIPAGENSTWLQAAGRDAREVSFPSNGYVVAGNSPDPEQFGGLNKTTFDASNPTLLLDRYTDTASLNYTEDTPVFELPRAPLLSVGGLQHLRIPGARPFSIGNSWGNGSRLNGINLGQLFDRYFFSGLVAGVIPSTANGAFSLPNPLLKVLPRNPATGAATTAADLKTAPNAQSSKFLLQGGAFNFNSVRKDAWVAVLRSVRFSSTADFSYLDASAATGTAADTTTAAGFTGAAFLRFPQSAQEIYKADDNYPQSQFGGGGPVITTPLYRRGVRVLSAVDVSNLAGAIVALIQQRQSVSGPFSTIEEFLSPATAGGPSLLEQAILDAKLNIDAAGNPIEFSSQFLTQGDIMTALAPVLFPRSDTFVIRTYGEAVNPTTGATEGRAWCEATVQRTPEYFDPTDDATVAPADLTGSLNQTYGRRFKVVSFRWLTRSDI
jgi:Tfp pilus assembly protein PilX